MGVSEANDQRKREKEKKKQKENKERKKYIIIVFKNVKYSLANARSYFPF